LSSSIDTFVFLFVSREQNKKERNKLFVFRVGFCYCLLLFVARKRERNDRKERVTLLFVCLFEKENKKRNKKRTGNF